MNCLMIDVHVSDINVSSPLSSLTGSVRTFDRSGGLIKLKNIVLSQMVGREYS